MKTAVIKESKVLLEVRRIKEEIAQEAERDPGFYQRMNGLGAKLLPLTSRKRRKAKSEAA